MSARLSELEFAEIVSKRGLKVKSRSQVSTHANDAMRQAMTGGTKPKKDYKAEFLEQIRNGRLPAPETEVRFHSTRKWRFDFAWPSKKIAVEYQGGIFYGNASHSGIAGLKRDCLKFSSATALGWRLFLINADMVRDGSAFGFIQDALGATK